MLGGMLLHCPTAIREWTTTPGAGAHTPPRAGQLWRSLEKSQRKGAKNNQNKEQWLATAQQRLMADVATHKRMPQ